MPASPHPNPKNDPHRPVAHFMPPANWMNDPNGTIWWKGRCHLFYQHNPEAPTHGRICWGHASSDDLVHWRHHPIALKPDQPYDEQGCYSGCCVDDNGTPTILYTGVQPQTQCVATGSDDLETWSKEASNPVIDAPPGDLDVKGFRDPWVWREQGQWKMIVGSGVAGQGGMALLYTSDDLRNWRYAGPIAQGEPGEMWECPSLIPIGDKWVLLCSPIPDGKSVHWMSGQWDGATFTPEQTGKVDFGAKLYASQPMRGPDGQWLLWSWIREARDASRSGWAGVMSLPRLLDLDEEGHLTQRPHPAVDKLLAEPHYKQDVQLESGNDWVLGASDAFELRARLTPGSARSLRIKVLASPDGREQVVLGWQVDQGHVFLDNTSVLDENVETRRVRAPIDPDAEGGIDLRLLVDRSVIELFAGSHVCMTARSYPTLSDSRNIELLAMGGSARLDGVEIRNLEPIW
jgi:beta-fructofuranosidase